MCMCRKIVKRVYLNEVYRKSFSDRKDGVNLLIKLVIQQCTLFIRSSSAGQPNNVCVCVCVGGGGFLQTVKLCIELATTGSICQIGCQVCWTAMAAFSLHLRGFFSREALDPSVFIKMHIC